MPSDSFQAILSALDGQLTLPEDSLTTAKEKMEAVHGLPTDNNTDIQWVDFCGTPCAIVTANEVTAQDRYLLYFRGGAFIAAGGDGFLFYAEMLSRQFNARVVMADYRMSPMHQFPAALDDCCNAYRGLLDSGVNTSRIAFIGDSCGGGLVLTTLLKLRDNGIELPACAISLSGWFDLASDNDNNDPLYHQAYCHKRGLDYAGQADLSNPLISPIFADFHDLPPLMLQAGSVDPTSAQASAIARKAQQTGVTVELDIVPEMIHGFQGFANLGIPESVAALSRAKAFLDETKGYPA